VTDPEKPPTARRARSSLVVALILVAPFLAGLAGGVALDRYVLHHRHGPFAGTPLGRGRPPINSTARAEMRKHMADRLASALDLTPQQRAQLDTILPRRLAAFDSLRREMAPRVQALLDSSSAAIEAILTPEQRAKWATLRRQMGPPAAP